MTRKLSLRAAVGCFALSVVCAGACHANEQVVVTGAGLLAEVVVGYANQYRTTKPGGAVLVLGTKTGPGFESLIQGNTQIVMATRKPTDDETDMALKNGVTLNEKLIGKICLLVITNEKNPVNELDMEQLRNIFTGQYTNWNQVGGPNQKITVATRAVPETGSGVEFQRIVLGGAPYASGSDVAALYSDMLKICSRSMGVGYIPATTSYFTGMGSHGVKRILVKRDPKSAPLYPAEGVVKNTDYPITIPFYLYWNAKAKRPLVTDFVTFCEGRVEASKSIQH